MKRPQDKQRVIFYNDKTFDFKVDESLQRLWRSIPLEGTDEKKIDEYLEKQGIQAMTTIGEAQVIKDRVIFFFELFLLFFYLKYSFYYSDL